MPNRLIHEQSPYLLQHANNPVDWFPWGEEPFELARKKNKPVLVSIGYAACHWCHVMEHESFENEEVANYMNEHFINIKVDREEHPDVDHLYMDAVQAITGSGGWPLNVFVTPEKLPFFGGTYYPPSAAFNRPSWMQLLQRMQQIWTMQQDEVKMQTEQMLQYLKNASQINFNKSDEKWNKETCDEIAETLLKQADKIHGGFGNAPKFPGTMAISYLLEHYHYTNNNPSLAHALLSLDKMIAGGIYDQLGGGFARYSTDAHWLAPHFEKMLYDNALILLSLCDAYQITKSERYKNIIEETITFVERELKDPSGIYYSALDADSEGEEGKFYTWTWEEWKNIFDEKDDILKSYFGIVEEGNWERTNILHIANDVKNIAKETGISTKEITQRISIAKEKLLQERSKRIRPITDDKSLLSWNALMNLALTKAGIVLDNETYLDRAQQHIDLLLEKFQNKNGLHHVWKNGVAKINANLDDYAYLIQALLQIASATGATKHIIKASKLCETVTKEFQQETGNFFYFTSERSTNVPVRKIDLYDGATPSANAVMAHNFFLLGLCMEKTIWSEQAFFMCRQMMDPARRYTYSFSYWALLLQRYAAALKTIIITGNNAETIQKELQEKLLPECYLLIAKNKKNNLAILKEKNNSQETIIFVCTQDACKAPVSSVDETLKLILIK